uniref:Dedicator of cytokinesis 9b n=1 Tax=Astyanax mexicanus TaxID=7994 RepID=A0A8B9RET0_ASTMX
MAPETRKFTRGLSKPGTAAELRQSVSEVVRTSVLVVKPKVIEPLDYESVLVQRKTQILSDVLRDMLQFPIDDFLMSTLRRQGRTLHPTVPEGAEKRATSLFVQECIKTYNSDWHVINYKYDDYSGDFRQLPNKAPRPEKLPTHVFEVDEDADKDEDTASLGSQRGGVAKHGWLYKGNMNSAISVTMRSFKRRYFQLAQLGDGSYNLNFYKDENISKEPKGTIFLDSCMGVVQNSKVRRFAFELKMQDKSTYLLSADNESEMDDWIGTLNKILHSSFEQAMQERRNGELHDDDLVKSEITVGNFQDSFQSARDIESKMRSETRLKLFTLDPDTQRLDLSGIEPDVKQFEEKFGKRVLVSCNDLSFNLQSCVAENEEGPTTNVEPFFVVLSLFDVQNSRKISADFHVDLNHPLVRSMISPTSTVINGDMDTPHMPMQLNGLPEGALQYPTQGVFSVTCPHPDIFLVARIEKVLQGGITHCAEPYMKSSDSAKVTTAAITLSFTHTHFIQLYIYCIHRSEYACVFFQCIYGRPGGPLFCRSAYAAVLHHQQNPEFYDEIKIELPTQLHEKHHLLFTFYHISCDSSTKKRDMVETQVGSAWLPLLKDGRVIMSEQQISVASNLPAGYLSCQEGLNKHSGPEVKWVDGGRPLFRVSTHLVSTVYTQDQHLHNFFHHCQKAQATEGELVKYLKSLHAMESHVMINFLPTILNQLVRVLTTTSHEDVAVNTTRVMVHIVAQCHEEGLEHYLRSYVKCYSASNSNGKTVHEELAKAMTAILKPSTDFLTSNKLLKYSWYFFEALVKSMAQHLIESGKVKLSRNQRFTASFHHAVETLVNMLMPHITQKYKDNLDAARNANHSLAVFIKRCFTFMDRGFVFKLINNYINCFVPGDPKTLYEFKFAFLRVVCNHEHFVPLNLPMPFGKGRIMRFQDLQLDYSLTDDFCRNHFLVGLLLREVGGALQEFGEIRQISIHVLKSLMIKHTFDDRYTSKSQQARLATLYLPLFGLLQENVHRLNVRDCFSLCKQSIKDPTTPHKPAGNPESSLHKDVFGVISGTASPHTSTPNIGAVRHADSRGSLVSTDSGNSLPEKNSEKSSSLDKTQSASALGSSILRCDKLDREEIKNLLMCFLYVLKSMSEDALFTYWNKATSSEMTDFFTLIEVCLHQFRYMGKRFIARSQEAVGFLLPDRKSLTLPVSRNRASVLHTRLHQLGSMENAHTFNHTYTHADSEACLLDANISTEVCLTVLDTLSIFIMGFKTQLCADLGHNPLMKKVFQVHLCFLQIPQSETALKHIFTSLRTFIYKFPCTFFDGRADMCACLCYEILKCCNSKLSTIRSDAAHLLYFLMKSNFDYTGRKSFVRTHLQARERKSKMRLNDHTAFPSDVKDLTKRIRTVLMATEQMKEHEKDPEMLVDLQYSLAKSYTSTPELRKTWLDSMAKIHVKNGDLSEAAMCYVHVAALVAEYLKRKGMFRQGCSAFRVITPNIDEEAAMMEDVGMQDVHFNEEVLMELLEECADGLWKAERYELISDIYRLIIPIYEQRRDFEKLAHLYDTLHRAYTKVMEVMHSGKRLLGTFFRVAFFGQGFFEDEDGKEYIYKEPKFTPLSEISQRLLKLYSDKFGQENVKMIQDSGRVNPKDLEAKFAYIQVTHVTPYLEEKELEERRTDFEKSHNIRRFVFETPFTASGKRHGGVDEQCKRRTVLTMDFYFLDLDYSTLCETIVYIGPPVDFALYRDSNTRSVAELHLAGHYTCCKVTYDTACY